MTTQPVVDYTSVNELINL